MDYILDLLTFSQACSVARYSINQIWADLWCLGQSILAWIVVAAIITTIAWLGRGFAR